MKKHQVVSILVSIGLSFGIVSTMSAEEMPKHNSISKGFQPIEQPIALKIAIAVGGLSLIGTQLWWFLLSKPKSQQAEINICIFNSCEWQSNYYKYSTRSKNIRLNLSEK